jgi:hypothetical protein
MDPEQFRTVLLALSLLMSAGASFYSWLATRDKEGKKLVSDLDEKVTKRLDAIDQKFAERTERNDARLTTLETMIKHLPTAEQIGGLRVAISDVAGEIKAVEVETKAIIASNERAARTLNRVEDFLLNRKP